MSIAETLAAYKDYETLPLVGFGDDEIGNAERLVARFRHMLRYCPPMKKWFVWDGRRWAEDRTGEAKRLAVRTAKALFPEAQASQDSKDFDKLLKHARASGKAKALWAMLDIAQALPGIPVLPEGLDQDPWLFNVENGTLDLRTGKLQPHNPLDMITKMAPVEYHAGAESDVWFKFLAEVTGGDGELADYIRRAVGYALQGKVTEKAFWFLYGLPDGGKSTFMNAIGHVFGVGEYYCPTNSDTWLVQRNAGGNRGDLVRLRGSRLVGSVEVRKGSKLDEALVKSVTGGDFLTACAKFQDDISFEPSFALWMAGNDAPEIRDDDEGSWSRVRRVPFTCNIPKERQDRAMPARLREDAVKRAILAWAVSGCLEWQRSGMGHSGAVDASSEAYRGEMDRTASFFEQECTFHPIERVEPRTLREAYEEWCELNGVKVLKSRKDFGQRLTARGCRAGNSHGRRYWYGVRLKTDEERDTDTGDGRDTLGVERS